MFKFLKEKLKTAISKFSKKAETEASEEIEVKEKEIKLDEKTILEEEKKIEEAKKKKETELKELEEKRKKEEGQKKKEEEERQKKLEKHREEDEEIQKKLEEERLEREAGLARLEEEKRKKEEELKKTKEEKEKIKREAEIKRLEEEKEKKEKEREQKEEERKKLEGQKREEEEERKKKEELSKLKEEEKKRKEKEEQRKKEEELKLIQEKEKEVQEKKGFFAKIKEKLLKKKEIEKGAVIKGEEKEIILEEVTEFEKKGFFAKVKEKVTTKKLDSKQFDELFWDLEIALLENNVAVEVIEKIKEDLKKRLVDVPLRRSEIQEIILESLRKSIESLFETTSVDLIQQVKYNEKPYIILFVGINGSGKTTTIAKIAHMMLKNGLKPIIAASDTFRAAAIQQLEEHGKKLGVKIVKHDYGADPSAVAFDAIKAAKAHKLDVVLIDTAGRMHSNQNLMDELKKVAKVTKPNLKLFIGESLTGNDCIDQARKFNETIGIDGIILTKLDVDEKGGAAISVSYVTQKPILLVGTGQSYDDLEPFNLSIVLKNLGF